MSKHSRNAVRKRAEHHFADLIRKKESTTTLLKVEMCRKAAALARSRAGSGHTAACSIAWISVNCRTTQSEAADWIAIGEAMLTAQAGTWALTCICDDRAEVAPVFLAFISRRETA